MDLAVFGPNGPTGRQVVRQALAAGHHVTAVTRKPDEYPLSAPHLDVVAADVTDPDGGPSSSAPTISGLLAADLSQ